MNIKNIAFLFPVMAYYAIESLIAALFITVLWRFVLYPITNIDITYLQCASIIWIIKIVFFDVFKLLTGLSGIQISKENQETDQETTEN